MKEVDQQLLDAASRGDAPACQLLLERGANIHAVDGGSRNALHRAARNGYTDICLLLLDHGAGVNAVDMNGWSVLHIAAWKGHADTCHLLLEHGSHAKLKNKDGKTALELVIKEKHEGCASAMRAWVTANAARQVLREIATDTPSFPHL